MATPGYTHRLVAATVKRLQRESRDRLIQAWQFALYGGARSKLPKLPEVLETWKPRDVGPAVRNDWRVVKAKMAAVIAAQKAEAARRAARASIKARPPVIRKPKSRPRKT